MRAFRFKTISSLNLGIILVVTATLAAILLFQKQRVLTNVLPGETVKVEFTSTHRISPFKSVAKIAGVPIGTVRSVERIDDTHTIVELKVEGEALDKMGSAPSAAIRPATLLGGNYYVDIIPGGTAGRFEGTIPAERTALPVELDAIAATLNEPAREGIRSSVSDLGETLDEDGAAALHQLLGHAPQTLGPADDVLQAVRGTQPGEDLRDVVHGLEAATRILSEKEGQLDASIADLATFTGTLDRRRGDLDATLADLPETLKSTDTTLTSLQTTLQTLEEDAGDIRPSVEKLDDLLGNLDPVLVDARPVIADLRVVARDARPLVEDLVPITKNLTGSLNDLEGPVLDRTNGPILTALNSGWQGSGPYAGTGSDHPLYKEIGYTVSNVTQANMSDAFGGMVSFQPGIGLGSVTGLPFSLDQLFQVLINQQGGTQ